MSFYLRENTGFAYKAVNSRNSVEKCALKKSALKKRLNQSGVVILDPFFVVYPERENQIK